MCQRNVNSAMRCLICNVSFIWGLGDVIFHRSSMFAHLRFRVAAGEWRDSSTSSVGGREWLAAESTALTRGPDFL
jgi:hypothetical protein